MRAKEEAGISGGAVKCVDIGKNTEGEGRPLGDFPKRGTPRFLAGSSGPDAEARKLGERSRLETCVVLAVNDPR